jgi:phosphatidyl-myo-inositol dimannoside synthase
MKILYITPGCFDKGGISRYSRYQIDALRELFGSENSRVLSLLGRESDGFEDDFSVDWAGTGNGMSSKIRFALQFFLQIILFRPDVVHVAHINFSGMARLGAMLCGAKTILNTYGLEVWSGLSKDAAWGLKNMDYVMADCHFTANYLEDSGLRPKNTVTVIWDCVDLERFKPAEKDLAIAEKYGIPNPNTHFIVMSLGRLAKAAAHKGYDRLIGVFATLAPHYPNARLVIAGRGDNRPHYEQLVAEKGISAQTVFTGSVDEQDLPALYRLASVFSLVSDRGEGRGEGIPLTPLEAMACRVPIIVGNHDGSQEAIVENKNGFVINPYDYDTHALHLKSLMDSAILQQKLSEGAVAVAQSVFSYPIFTQKHKDLYQKIQP